MSKNTLSMTLAFVGLCICSASAQSLQERIESLQRRGGVNGETTSDEAASQMRLARAINEPLEKLDLQDVTANQVVAYLSEASGVDIVVNWKRLEEQGIDPQQTVQIVGTNITPAKALDLLIQQLGESEPMLWETTPWYVSVMTKKQANLYPVVIVYPIDDLLHVAPNFTAPQFSLSQATQSQNAGGSGGSGSSSNNSLFEENENRDSNEKPASKTERGEEMAELIRQTVEPEIWREKGGEGGSIRYFNGSLIINAPMYVHRQIGSPRTRVRSTPLPRYLDGKLADTNVVAPPPHRTPNPRGDSLLYNKKRTDASIDQR